MASFGVTFNSLLASAPGDNPAGGSRRHLLEIFDASDKNIIRLPQIENLKASTLHNEYSINGIPGAPGKPEPSRLDLDGTRPVYEYKRNLPPGARV